jgi:type I restriction enzyme, S subunit
MELTKSKYKQTEVGLIPEDWFIFTTIEAAKNSEAGIKIGPFGSALKKELLVKQGFKVYGQENVFDKDAEIGDRFITQEHFRKLRSCELIPGDFIISMMGTIGQSMILPRNIQPGIMDSHLLRIRLDEAKVFPNYFEHIFSSSISLNQVKKLSVGGIMDGLSSKIVKRVQYPFPPTLTEQKAIAEALSDVDELIANLYKLIVKKKAIKQGAMQQLLTPPNKGGKRLPGFSGEWEEINLGESATLKARIGWQGLTTDEYLSTGKYYLITGTDFKNGFIDWDNCVFVEKDRYVQDKNIQVAPDDVLVTKDGTIGKVAFIDKINMPTTLNSGVFVIRPIRQSYHPRYFYYILMSEHFRDFLGKLTAGSTISHLYQKDFVNYTFPAPKNIDEQEAISEILFDMDIDISALTEKKKKYQDIKQGMMQELLTGKTRLV